LSFQAKANSTLYNNLNATSSGAFDLTTYAPEADSFSTSGFNVTLTDVKLLMDRNSSTSGSFTVSLLSNASNTPGAVLATIATVSDSALSTSLTPLDLQLTNPYLLEANTRYWIELTDTNISTASWSFSTDISGPGVVGEYNSDAFALPMNGTTIETSPFQMEVTAAAVPEPSTLFMTTVGCLSFTGYFWRMRRKCR
jgi:hypothetical protein